MKTTPINELRAFLLAVSKHGNQHLAEIEADLQQTTYLLNEAIDQLGSGFSNVHQLAQSQQAALRQLSTVSSATQDQVQQYEDEMNKEMNAIVTSMQFQDMTNQLLGKTIKQVNGLKALLNTLSEHGHDMPAEQEHEDIVNFLATAQENLHQSSQALSGGLRNSVGQKDMATGDIDLF